MVSNTAAAYLMRLRLLKQERKHCTNRARTHSRIVGAREIAHTYTSTNGRLDGRDRGEQLIFGAVHIGPEVLVRKPRPAGWAGSRLMVSGAPAAALHAGGCRDRCPGDAALADRDAMRRSTCARAQSPTGLGRYYRPSMWSNVTCALVSIVLKI